MNEIWEAIILGIVQGLTEFLPVSSSGHIEIARYVLGDSSTGEQSLIMTVVLHFATALATIYVFRSEVRELLFKGLTFKDQEDSRYLLYLLISLIPAALVGFFFEEAIEAMFAQDLLLVGSALIVTAILLVLADRSKVSGRGVESWSAFIIGVAQAVAIVPGISRSGATIATSVLLKIDRERAARFSFLMVVPLIFGKVARDLLFGEWGVLPAFAPLTIGFIFAFFTGVLACIWMISLVKRAKLRYFGYYCVLVGLTCILLVNDVF